MSLDGNQTTIFANSVSYTTTSRDISRVMVVIPFTKYTEGITFGDVIRFNNTDGPDSGQYVKSSAASNIGAEVFGIVEGYNSNTKSISVVIQGSVIIPSNKLNIVTTDGNNAGGNDIYFLSGMTAGELQNAAPTTVNFISKPIYQVAPHGEFTGVVKNYLGWKNNSIDPFIVETKLMSMSDDMTKSIYYWEDANRFLIYSQTYDSNTFTKVEEYTIDKSVLEKNSNKLLNYNLTDTYDIKISDDGKEILVFDKSFNTISYIHVDQSNNALIKFVLNVDLVGSPQDKIWAVDNNITCLTVGTKSITREELPTDSFVNCSDLSTNIEYWKRNMNNIDYPFNWRKTFNQGAFGHVSSKPFVTNNDGPGNDEIYTTNGINRLSDIYSKGSNFVLSCRTLKQDQNDYKSKFSYYYSERYSDEIMNILGNTYDGVNLRTIISVNNLALSSMPLLTNKTPSFTNNNSIADTPTFKKYCCSFGINQYQILRLIDSYYHEDMSYKTQHFNYPFPAALSGAVYNASSFNNTPGKTLSNSIKELNQLSRLDHLIETVLYTEPGSVSQFSFPMYERNALFSRSKCTETFSAYAFLYEYINVSDGTKANQLIIIKLPFFAEDGLNVLKYYSRSGYHLSVVPNNGTGYGYITSFRTTTFSPQSVNGYYGIESLEKIPSVFSSENILTNPNINQIRSFEFFTSNYRFFISTSTKIIIWTYSSSTYVIVDAINFDLAKFWYTANGEFFMVDGILYKYNSSSQIFEEQTI